MSSKIQSIQIWRILACIGVFVVHLGQRMGLYGAISVLTDFGKYGVYLFFIISGFLACYSIDAKVNKRQYWLKRAIKILPLYYGVILFYFITETFIFKSIPYDPTGLGWSRYILFLSGFVKAEGYFWSNLGITWTIPVFVLFYAVYPIFSNRLSSFRNSLIGLFFSLIISFTISEYANGNLLSITYLPFFMLGIILFYALKENRKELLLFLLAISILFMVVCGIWDYKYLYSLLFLILIISSINVEINNQSIIDFINMVDKYTYTVYLTHGIIFCSIIDKNIFSPVMIFIIASIGTVLLAFLVLNFWEQPIQRKLNKLFRLK